MPSQNRYTKEDDWLIRFVGVQFLRCASSRLRFKNFRLVTLQTVQVDDCTNGATLASYLIHNIFGVGRDLCDSARHC